MKDKVNVVAVEKGFHVTLREPGEKFDMPPPVPSWCKKAGEAERTSAPVAQTDTGNTGGTGSTGEGAGGPVVLTEGVEAYHVGGGRYGIRGADGERIGEFTGSKEEAEAEAERINAGDPDLNDHETDLPDA